MKKLILLLSFFIVGCEKKEHTNIPIPGLTVNTPVPVPGKTLNIMLAGQSNMARFYVAPHYYGEVELQAKLNKAGYAVNFVECAVGGTTMDQWAPNGALTAQCDSRAAGRKIDAILFYQGEADAMVYNPNWPMEFMSLARYWQSKYLGVKIIFTQIDDNTMSGVYPDWTAFQNLQLTITTDQNLRMVSAIGLPVLPNNVHLEPIAYVSLADLYVNKLLEMGLH